jgi:gliding motility-associated-like protein
MMKQPAVFILAMLVVGLQAVRPQSSVDAHVPMFLTPDTVCVGQEVNIVNVIVGSSYYWNFCTANATYPPQGLNMGNPGNLLSDPRFITLVQDSLDCYSFVTGPGVQGLIRNYHGNSFFNAPTSSVVSNFSLTTDKVRGVRMEKENGTWTAFVANGPTLVRMVFDVGLAGAPTVVDIGLSGITAPTGLEILKDGANWFGFLLDSLGNTLNRLDFGTSLLNFPAVTNLGNVGQMDGPAGLAARFENGQWYLLVCNEGTGTLSRISFGNSLTNSPAGTNLGNLGVLENCTGISLLQDCERLNGYVINHSSHGDPLVHIEFAGGVGGAVTGTPAGNPGGMLVPYGISQMLRVGDTICSYVTNTWNSTLTLLYFPVCTASSIPSYSGPTPPPFSYLVPGNYNIILTINEGTALQTVSCNNITVIPVPVVTLGPDRLICQGNSTTLDAGAGFTSYLWNNGATSRTVTTDTAGTFSVQAVNRFGCGAWDTLTVTVTTAVTVNTDTAICYGSSYFCGGQPQTSAGIYYDTLQTFAGCDSVIVTSLLVKDSIHVDIGPDTVLCPGDLIVLNASTPGAAYRWQNGNTDSLFPVQAPGLYWVVVTREGCAVSDSINISPCPVKIWFPTAFTPDNNGVNDTFRPRGVSIGRFSMTIYDRWGEKVFETDNIDIGWTGLKNGQPGEAGTYSYVAYYSPLDDPGKTYKVLGTVTLVR